MNKISTSPDRHSFQRDCYLKRISEEGKTAETNSDVKQMLELFENISIEKTKREADPSWQKNNLEYELRTTAWILEKVRLSEAYAQNLYAAMCNNGFKKNDARWACSWRYAGGIIADMREQGDYIDWYCSGIRSELTEEDVNKLTPEQKERHEVTKNFVGECVVTDEIREDIQKLGWEIVD
jgi:hypothetical protein